MIWNSATVFLFCCTLTKTLTVFFIIRFFFFSFLIAIVNSFARPSGHSGGASHLSTSRCCSPKLFPSKLSTGRHQQWRQMLLHKPAASQRGHYSIKQTALSTWYGNGKKQKRKKTRCSGLRSENSVGTGSGLFAQYMRVCLWTFVCNFAWLFHPLATHPSANCLLSCETKVWRAGTAAASQWCWSVQDQKCHPENQPNADVDMERLVWIAKDAVEKTHFW